VKAVKAVEVELEARSLNDRRTVEVPYKRRVFDRRTKTFKYERTIHLSDTNMFGSVYFARFFDLQGETREEFLQYFMGADFPEFISQKLGIVTVDAYCKYHAPLFLYDDIVMKLRVTALKRTKFHLEFQAQRTRDKLCAATGEQWIGFTTAEGKPIAIPEIVLKNLKRFVIS
jgi:acyl-CoA thioesterase FadM